MLFWYHAKCEKGLESFLAYILGRKRQDTLVSRLAFFSSPSQPSKRVFYFPFLADKNSRRAQKWVDPPPLLGEIKEGSYYNINSIIKKMRMWNEIFIKYHSVTLGKHMWQVMSRSAVDPNTPKNRTQTYVTEPEVGKPLPAVSEPLICHVPTHRPIA